MKKPNPYASRNGGDPDKPWYDQPRTFCDPYQLKAPYDRIYVGPDPGDGMTKEFADQFDAIVNVSSTKCATFEPSRPDQRTYWYPVIEMGRWSHGYLLWLKEVLDFHYDQGHKIYLHCHAGAFRSPSAACLWLESRGHSPEEALVIGYYLGAESLLHKIQANHGNIPKHKDALFGLFREQQKRIDESGHGTLCIEALLTYGISDPWDHEIMSGRYRRANLKRHYFWFYYQPKEWLRERWRDFKYWLKGYGHIREGCGTYYYDRKYFFAFGKNTEPVFGQEKIGHWQWNETLLKWEAFEVWDDRTMKWKPA